MCLFRRRQACFDLFEATIAGIPSGDNDGCKLTNKGPPAKPKILKDKNKNKDFLEEGAPSCDQARRRRRSCSITPCCPPVVKGRYGYHIYRHLCSRTDELVVD